MTLIIEQGKVNNGGIVLSKPLSLPEGTEIRVQIEPIDTHDSTSTVTDESEDFANLPCFGMWADREEMRDSVAWLQKEREKWHQRNTDNPLKGNADLIALGGYRLDSVDGAKEIVKSISAIDKKP